MSGNSSESTEPSESYEEGRPIAHLPNYRDRSVTTYLVDGFSGVASINGIERITFVESIFNAAPGADAPIVQPAVILAIPRHVLLSLASMVIAPMAGEEGAAQ